MNVILTSVGRRSYLVEYFREALNGSGYVVATNTHTDATGMFEADIPVVVPPASDPTFGNALRKICQSHAPALLFSLHDWEAPFLAAMSGELRALGVLPVMPALDVIRVCLDKYATGKLAARWGARAPHSYLSVADALTGVRSGEVCYPLVVKPRWGQGSLGLFHVNDDRELECAFDLCRAHAGGCGSSFGLMVEADRQVMVQQRIAGVEYGVDIVNDLDGNFAKAFVKRKLAMRSGETDSAETVAFPAIEACAARIAGWSRHLGNMDADFMVDADGSAYLLELNPRFGGGYPFTHAAGVNLPRALLAWAQHRQADPDWLTVRLGVRAYKDIRVRTVS